MFLSTASTSKKRKQNDSEITVEVRTNSNRLKAPAGHKPDSSAVRRQVFSKENPRGILTSTSTEITCSKTEIEATNKEESHRTTDQLSCPITKTALRKLSWSTLERIMLPFLSETESKSIHLFTKGIVTIDPI